MYFDSDTPDEMSLFNDEREQAREENQVQRQFDRMLNEPDYLSEAAVLARSAFAAPASPPKRTIEDVLNEVAAVIRRDLAERNPQQTKQSQEARHV